MKLKLKSLVRSKQSRQSKHNRNKDDGLPCADSNRTVATLSDSADEESRFLQHQQNVSFVPDVAEIPPLTQYSYRPQRCWYSNQELARMRVEFVQAQYQSPHIVHKLMDKCQRAKRKDGDEIMLLRQNEMVALTTHLSCGNYRGLERTSLRALDEVEYTRALILDELIGSQRSSSYNHKHAQATALSLQKLSLPARLLARHLAQASAAALEDELAE